MFSATRVAAGVAVLALAGTFALLAMPGSQEPVGPGAQAPVTDPADFGGFSGTMICAAGVYGTSSSAEGIILTEGETYDRCPIEVSDPRFTGNNYSVHDYYRYDFKPQWGVRSVGSVVTNADGSWVSEQDWGYQHPEHGAMRYAAVYRGTGAYEGLTALMFLSQDVWGLAFDVEGVIFPGDLAPAPEPPIEAARAIQEELAARAESSAD